MYDHELRYTRPVKAEDLKGKFVPDAFFADLRYIAEVGGQEPAHGLIVVLDFVRELVNVKFFLEVVNVGEEETDTLKRF